MVNLSDWFAVHRLMSLVSHGCNLHIRVRLRYLNSLKPIITGRQRVSKQIKTGRRVTMKGLTQRRGSQLRSKGL